MAKWLVLRCLEADVEILNQNRRCMFSYRWKPTQIFDFAFLLCTIFFGNLCGRVAVWNLRQKSRKIWAFANAHINKIRRFSRTKTPLHVWEETRKCAHVLCAVLDNGKTRSWLSRMQTENKCNTRDASSPRIYDRKESSFWIIEEKQTKKPVRI